MCCVMPAWFVVIAVMVLIPLGFEILNRICNIPCWLFVMFVIVVIPAGCVKTRIGML